MKTDRMLSITMILLQRSRVSIAELAEICEVSPRTISRDLEAINQAGIPIVTYPGAHGGASIMEGYKLDRRLFSVADLVTLLVGLDGIRPALSGDDVANALAKVRGFIPEDQLQEIERRAARVTVDATPWVGTRDGKAVVASLQDALDANRLVRFAYRDRMGTRSERTIEPYRLVLKESRWYVEGYCRAREGFRFFKLSRMSGVTVLDETFSPRPFDPAGRVEPRFRDEGIVKAVLRVDEATLDHLVESGGAKPVKRDGEDRWIAETPVPDSEHGWRYIVGLGAGCECLEPASLRRGVSDYLERMRRVYAAD